MSWLRRVKTIYTINLVILFFILFSIIYSFTGENPTYLLIPATLFVIFLCEYLIYKTDKKILAITLAVALSIVLTFLITNTENLFSSLLFIIISMLIILKNEEINISYTRCKATLMGGLYLTIPLSIFISILNSGLMSFLFRAFVVYVIVMILTFKERLKYEYNIRNESATKINLGVIIGIVILSQDKCINILYKISSWIMDKLLSLISNAFIFITNLLKVPITAIMNFFKNIISKLFSNFDIGILNNLSEKTMENKTDIEISSIQNTNFDISIIVKVLIFILIIYGIYKFLSNININIKSKENYVEVIESLEDDQLSKNKKKHINLKEKFFRKKGTIKEEIKYTYKDFEKKTREIDIFRPYMTPTQIKNVVKIKVNNIEGLEDITNIYNEAKFSNHDLTEEHLNKIKDSYNIIKHNIK